MNFTVEQQQQNQTLNVFLRSKGLSVALIRKLKFFEDGILVNQKKQNVDYKLSKDEKVTINIYDRQKDIQQSTVIPQDMPMDILYMDEYCMVVNKPYFMPIHPSLNHSRDTLANAFCGYWQARGQQKICRVMNRLDKNTSGLVIIALDAHSAENLKGKVDKIYTAIVQGKVLPKSGVIEKPIARTENSIITRTVSDSGQYAKTEYQVVNQNKSWSLLDIKLHTGRTHQIRVHFSYIGHPLLGDDIYGGKTDKISRHALHCRQLSFNCLQTNEKITINSQIPKDMENIVSEL